MLEIVFSFDFLSSYLVWGPNQNSDAFIRKVINDFQFNQHHDIIKDVWKLPLNCDYKHINLEKKM